MYICSNPVDLNSDNQDINDQIRIQEAEWGTTLMTACLVVSLFQGIVLGVVRARNEPFFYHIIMQEMYSWFGEVHIEDTDVVTQSTFTMMAAQLSIDLVYTILHSICENTVGVKKSSKWLQYMPYDFLNKHETQMDKMIVWNAAQMQVGKTEQQEKADSSALKRAPSDSDIMNTSGRDFPLKRRETYGLNNSFYSETSVNTDYERKLLAAQQGN